MSMTPWAPWPVVEYAVMDLIAPLCPNVGRKTPADFTGALPFLHVVRFGGTDDRITDVAAISVDTFAADPDDAQQLAERVRQVLLAYPHTTADGVIDRITTTSAPAQAFPANLAVYMWAATYRVTARRPTS